MLLCSFNSQFWFWVYDVQHHQFLNICYEIHFYVRTLLRSSERHYVDVAMFFLLLCWFTLKKLFKTLCCCCNVHSWEVLQRRYISVAMFSPFLLLLDVTLIIKLLKSDKLLKFCYLVDDSEDLNPDADVVKGLTEDSDFSFVFLLLMFRQLFIKSQWIWR